MEKMDMSDLVKRHLAKLHKGTVRTKTVQDRKEDFIKDRKSKRETLAFARRNIDINMSPYNTPSAAQTSQKTESKLDAKKTFKTNAEGCNKRLEMLAKWKVEKAKQKQLEKAAKKPIFKVCHVSSESTVNLENVNKLIKGRAILTSAIKKSQFAPENHKFRPPNGIKPLHFDMQSMQNKALAKPEKALTKSQKSTPTPGSSKPTVSRTKQSSQVREQGQNKHAAVIARLSQSCNSSATNNWKVTQTTKPKTTNITPKPTLTSAIRSKQTPSSSVSRKKIEPKILNRKSTETNALKSSKRTTDNSSKKIVRKEATNNNSSMACETLNAEKASTSLKKSKNTRNNSSPKKIKKDATNSSTSVACEALNDEEGAEEVPTENKSLKKSKNTSNNSSKKKEATSKSLSKPCEDLNDKKDVEEIVKTVDVSDSPRTTPVHVSSFVTMSRGKKKSKNIPRNSLNQKVKKEVTNSSCEVLNDEEAVEEASTENKYLKRSKNTPNDSLTKKCEKEATNNSTSMTCEALNDEEGVEEATTENKGLKKSRNNSLKKKLQKEVINESLSKHCGDVEEIVKAVDVSDSPRTTPVYLSPFVTISRGKRLAREEFKVRRSYGKETFNQTTPEVSKVLNAYTSPQAGADYFMVKLDTEIDRINEICKAWEEVLEDPELPEEPRSSIDVAIGQSKLLIAKKFEQFRSLIVQCKTKQYDEKVITCEDLHGFWDMIYMQVEDLDKRFANLERLKNNNWLEMLLEKKASIKKTRARAKKTKAASRLKDMIRAAREKRKEENNQQSEENKLFVGGYFEIKTPLKQLKTPQEVTSTNSKRKSLRVSVLTTQCGNRCSSSPGLTMMKVSQSIKQGNGLTPSKSILKPEGFKSTGKKSVIFQDSFSPKNLTKTILFNENSKESARKSLIFCEGDKENSPCVRRSSRLAK